MAVMAAADIDEADGHDRPGLFQQIHEDWVTHRKDWTCPGFRAIAVYRFGVWRMGIEPRYLRAPLSVLHRFLYRRIRNRYGIEINSAVRIGRRVLIEHQHGIVLHGLCSIGDDTIIRQGVTIGNRYLDRPLEAPRLGRGVNIGAGAKILGNVSIGDGASIGANAVVLIDVPNGATAVGNPAEVVQSRRSQEKRPAEPLRRVARARDASMCR